MLFCKKGVLTNFAKFPTKHQEKRFRQRCFPVNSAKFLIISFLKNPSDGCFSINIRSVYCPTMTFRNQKRCHTHFPAEYFFGLIYTLGTRVSSIFQALSQKPIFNPVEHLQWGFFAKIINSLKPLSIFAKKARL